MLEWITLGIAASWIIAVAILVNCFCDRENEILKQNLLLISGILQVLAYLGFTHMSFLPHGNALIRSEKYEKGSKEFRYQKESKLRSFALMAKITVSAILIFIGLSQYIF